MKKNILILTLGIIILLGGFYGHYYFKNNEITNNKDNYTKKIIKNPNTGKSEEIIIDNTDYGNLGINPNDYPKLNDFLSDIKTFSGSENLDVDLEKENFVITMDGTESGSTIYVQFSQDIINGGKFDSIKDKNSAIVDIYNAYKNQKIFGGVGSRTKNKIIFGNDVVHKETKLLGPIFGLEVKIDDLLYELSKVSNKSQSKVELYSYLQELKGNYEKATVARKSLIEEKTYLKELHYKEFQLDGVVYDQKDKPIVGAKIDFLNEKGYEAITDKNGKYSIKFDYYDFAHMRFKISKKGYSDSFLTISNNSHSESNWHNFNYRTVYLKKYINKEEINNENISKYMSKKRDGYIVIKTKQSEYLIPIDGLVYKDGTPYHGESIEVYTYEFTKWDKLDGLLEVDTFSEVYGYMGNMMKTFGMPYIQFFDKETEKELFIAKSNPMILTNQIYHMQELYDNHDKIYEAITEEDMIKLVEDSNRLGGYPIDYDYLIENNFLRWPAWWALDRKKGIWENVGMSVKTKEGLVELPFYSLNDID